MDKNGENAEEEAPIRFRKGEVVSLSRLAGGGAAMARPIGIGELLGPLEIGRVPRIRLDQQNALSPTPIIRIESIGPDILRITTQNSRYELRRVNAVVPILGPRALEPGAADPEGESEENERTQMIALSDWPVAAQGRFESGARVEIVKERDGETRELGSGILLIDLVAGESASFSVEDSIVGTSPIREITELSKDSVRIVTANSSYRLRLEPGNEHD